MRPPRTALAGRDRELERLAAALDRCGGGTGGLVLLEGHAGAGKSRLTRELAAAGRERGVDLMLGRCLEDPVAPYHPFADALGAAAAAGAALAESAGPLGAELARLVPRLPEPAGPPAPVPAEPGLARLRLFEAVTACLVNRPRPLLLVVEDLHWADGDSLRLLEHVVRGAADAPLLVLGTARPGAPAVAAALSTLEREGAAERIEVTDLDRTSSDALVAAWLGDALDPGAGAELYERTSGNPFYLEEALRDIAESGTTPGPRRVPRTVRGVVRQRIARLGSATESALVVGAVAGRRFSLDTVEPLAGGEGVLEALERAVDANLLVEDPRAPGEFAFAHALVRDAVYEDLSLARRARLHVRLAEQLERDDAPRRTRAAEIAHHRLQSGRTEDVAQAGALLREAADLARDALSYERAASLYGRALASAAPEGRERATLLLELGRARVRAGDAGGGRDAFRAAAAEARTLGDGRLTAEAALGFGGLGVSILDVDAESVALLDEALDRLPASTPRLRSRCLSRLAVELYYTPGRDRSLALSAEALELAGRENEPLTLLHALNARHVALWTPDHPRERLALAERMVTLAAEAGLPELELQGRNWRVADLFELGRLDEQDREIDAHARLVEDLRLAAYRWWAPAWRAGRALLRGDFSAAERLMREARDAAAAGDRNAERAGRQLALGLAFTRGRWGEAPLADIERLVAASPATIAWRTALAWILAELGDAAGADAHLALLERDGFAAPRDANWPSAVVEAAEACAIVGRTGLARRLYALLEPFGGRIAPSGRAIHCLGAYDRVRGRLATVLGEPDRADAHFRDAAVLERRLGARPWLLRTLSHHADVLRRRAGPGDGERAASLLAEAAVVADAIGVPHHADPALPVTASVRSGQGRLRVGERHR